MNRTTRQSPDQIERNIYETRRQIEDTLETLQRKLSPGEMLHAAADFARHNGSSLTSNAATMAANAGRTARDNPIPLALLGVGLAWLMIGGRRAAEASEASVGREPDANPCRGAEIRSSRPRNDAEKVRQTAKQAADRVGDTARSAADRAGAAASNVRTRATEAASRARQRVEDTADDFRAGGEAGAAKLRSGVAAAASSARRIGGDARSGASRAVRSTSRYAHDHPLATGAMMVAAGALFAALMPRTRAEDRLVGEESDRVRAGAEEKAADLAQRTRQAGEAAIAEAKSEAERHGLTPEGAKREAAAAAEAGADVAVSAAEAARNELKRGDDSEEKKNKPIPARKD